MRRLCRFGLLAVVILTSVSAGRTISAADEPPNTESAAAETHGEHPKGPPLLPEVDLAFWSLVVFICFVWLLKRYAWGPLIEGLDKRESHLRGELAAAQEARHKAEQLLAQHAEKLEHVADEVRELLANARADADRAKQEIVTEARNEAETTRKRAVEEIEQARDQAVSELFQFMADSVTDATEHVLGRSMNDQDNKRLIEEAVSQFSNQAR